MDTAENVQTTIQPVIDIFPPAKGSMSVLLVMETEDSLDTERVDEINESIENCQTIYTCTGKCSFASDKLSLLPRVPCNYHRCNNDLTSKLLIKGNSILPNSAINSSIKSLLEVIKFYESSSHAYHKDMVNKLKQDLHGICQFHTSLNDRKKKRLPHAVQDAINGLSQLCNLTSSEDKKVLESEGYHSSTSVTPVNFVDGLTIPMQYRKQNYTDTLPKKCSCNVDSIDLSELSDESNKDYRLTNYKAVCSLENSSSSEDFLSDSKLNYQNVSQKKSTIKTKNIGCLVYTDKVKLSNLTGLKDASKSPTVEKSINKNIPQKPCIEIKDIKINKTNYFKDYEFQNSTPKVSQSRFLKKVPLAFSEELELAHNLNIDSNINKNTLEKNELNDVKVSSVNVIDHKSCSSSASSISSVSNSNCELRVSHNNVSPILPSNDIMINQAFSEFGSPMRKKLLYERNLSKPCCFENLLVDADSELMTSTSSSSISHSSVLPITQYGPISNDTYLVQDKEASPMILAAEKSHCSDLEFKNVKMHNLVLLSPDSNTSMLSSVQSDSPSGHKKYLFKGNLPKKRSGRIDVSIPINLLKPYIILHRLEDICTESDPIFKALYKKVGNKKGHDSSNIINKVKVTHSQKNSNISGKCRSRILHKNGQIKRKLSQVQNPPLKNRAFHSSLDLKNIKAVDLISYENTNILNCSVNGPKLTIKKKLPISTNLTTGSSDAHNSFSKSAVCVRKRKFCGMSNPQPDMKKACIQEVFAADVANSCNRIAVKEKSNEFTVQTEKNSLINADAKHEQLHLINYKNGDSVSTVSLNISSKLIQDIYKSPLRMTNAVFVPKHSKKSSAYDQNNQSSKLIHRRKKGSKFRNRRNCSRKKLSIGKSVNYIKSSILKSKAAEVNIQLGIVMDNANMYCRDELIKNQTMSDPKNIKVMNAGCQKIDKELTADNNYVSQSVFEGFGTYTTNNVSYSKNICPSNIFLSDAKNINVESSNISCEQNITSMIEKELEVLSQPKLPTDEEHTTKNIDLDLYASVKNSNVDSNTSIICKKSCDLIKDSDSFSFKYKNDSDILVGNDHYDITNFNKKENKNTCQMQCKNNTFANKDQEAGVYSETVSEISRSPVDDDILSIFADSLHDLDSELEDVAAKFSPAFGHKFNQSENVFNNSDELTNRPNIKNTFSLIFDQGDQPLINLSDQCPVQVLNDKQIMHEFELVEGNDKSELEKNEKISESQSSIKETNNLKNPDSKQSEYVSVRNHLKNTSPVSTETFSKIIKAMEENVVKNHNSKEEDFLLSLSENKSIKKMSTKYELVPFEENLVTKSVFSHEALPKANSESCEKNLCSYNGNDSKTMLVDQHSVSHINKKQRTVNNIKDSKNFSPGNYKVKSSDGLNLKLEIISSPLKFKINHVSSINKLGTKSDLIKLNMNFSDPNTGTNCCSYELPTLSSTFCRIFFFEISCSSRRCTLSHKMPFHILSTFLSDLIVYYVHSGDQIKAWNLLQFHMKTQDSDDTSWATSALKGSTLAISALKGLAKMHVEMKLEVLLELPSQLIIYLETAKLQTFCDKGLGKEAFEILLNSLNSQVESNALKYLFFSFIRFCEMHSNSTLQSPYEKAHQLEYTKILSSEECLTMKRELEYDWLLYHIENHNMEMVKKCYAHLTSLDDASEKCFSDLSLKYINYLQKHKKHSEVFEVMEKLKNKKIQNVKIFSAISDSLKSFCDRTYAYQFFEALIELQVKLTSNPMCLTFVEISMQYDIPLVVKVVTYCAKNMYQPSIKQLTSIAHRIIKSDKGPEWDLLHSLVSCLSHESLSGISNILEQFIRNVPPGPEANAVIRTCKNKGVNLIAVISYNYRNEGTGSFCLLKLQDHQRESFFIHSKEPCQPQNNAFPELCIYDSSVENLPPPLEMTVKRNALAPLHASLKPVGSGLRKCILPADNQLSGECSVGNMKSTNSLLNVGNGKQSLPCIDNRKSVSSLNIEDVEHQECFDSSSRVTSSTFVGHVETIEEIIEEMSEECESSASSGRDFFPVRNNQLDNFESGLRKVTVGIPMNMTKVKLCSSNYEKVKSLIPVIAEKLNSATYLSDWNSQKVVVNKIYLMFIQNQHIIENMVKFLNSLLSYVLTENEKKGLTGFTATETKLIGHLGSSLLTYCVECNLLEPAENVILSLHRRYLRFYAHMPVQISIQPNSQRIAVMCLDVLNMGHHMDEVVQILEDMITIPWFDAGDDVPLLKIKIVSEVTDKLLTANREHWGTEYFYNFLRVIICVLKTYHSDRIAIGSRHYDDLIDIQKLLFDAGKLSRNYLNQIQIIKRIQYIQELCTASDIPLPDLEVYRMLLQQSDAKESTSYITRGVQGGINPTRSEMLHYQNLNHRSLSSSRSDRRRGSFTRYRSP